MICRMHTFRPSSPAPLEMSSRSRSEFRWGSVHFPNLVSTFSSSAACMSETSTCLLQFSWSCIEGPKLLGGPFTLLLSSNANPEKAFISFFLDSACMHDICEHSHGQVCTSACKMLRLYNLLLDTIAGGRKFLAFPLFLKSSW